MQNKNILSILENKDQKPHRYMASAENYRHHSLHDSVILENLYCKCKTLIDIAISGPSVIEIRSQNQTHKESPSVFKHFTEIKTFKYC